MHCVKLTMQSVDKWWGRLGAIRAVHQGGGSLKVASIGPHLVVPAQEETSVPEVIDYREVAQASHIDTPENSTGEANQESGRFARIFDLIEKAKERSGRDRRPNQLRQQALFKYKLRAEGYEGPKKGTTYAEEA